MTSELLIQYVSSYGYVGIFLILAISILGLPVPDIFLLTFIGYLTHTGKLDLITAIISADLGSVIGITSAYLFGLFFRNKVLTHLTKHTGSQRLERVFNWYLWHGSTLLAIGYFFPGVRHLSGYIAGLSKMDYRYFATFAYLGATFWTFSLIILGRFLGSQWKTIYPVIHHYYILLTIIVITIFLLGYIISSNYNKFLNFVRKKK
jgi:undecaprenyl-diphosphatase